MEFLTNFTIGIQGNICSKAVEGKQLALRFVSITEVKLFLRGTPELNLASYPTITIKSYE